MLHSLWPLVIVGHSLAHLGCARHVTDFSQQEVCHADLFIILTGSVVYQRNELIVCTEVFKSQSAQSTDY